MTAWYDSCPWAWKDHNCSIAYVQTLMLIPEPLRVSLLKKILFSNNLSLCSKLHRYDFPRRSVCDFFYMYSLPVAYYISWDWLNQGCLGKSRGMGDERGKREVGRGGGFVEEKIYVARNEEIDSLNSAPVQDHVVQIYQHRAFPMLMQQHVQAIRRLDRRSQASPPMDRWLSQAPNRCIQL